MPKPSEVAQLKVAGHVLEDWETVWVQHRWRDGWPLFRFTTAERDNLPTDWKKLQFRPGDPCQINLGGQQAMEGIILTRQTAYDANNHAVQLSGAGKTYMAATSSVKTKDGNFDKQNVQQVADKVTAPFGVKALPVGTLDLRPFDRLSCQPGELVFDFLDRICRVRGITLASDHLGNFLLIGQHTKPIVQQLYEGQNILKMQCIISIEQTSTDYSVTAQKAGDDQAWGKAAAEMRAKVTGSAMAMLPDIYKWIETVIEQPVKEKAEVEARANYEAIAHEGTLVTAYVTVQGWLRDGKDLWRTGDNVWVYSPMAMLNMVMKIKTATFSQDDRTGTTTLLELVLPWALGDKYYSAGPQWTRPPDPATTTSDKPAEAPKPIPLPPERPPGTFDPGGELGPGPYP